MWLHVDGAYGGAALAAPSARHLFNGIELADSFIVDPHKWFFAPYDCCALLYRHPEPARAAQSQDAGYLDTIDRDVGNPWDHAVHLTRRARGLPFWFSLATHGTNRYTAAIEQTLATARAVAEGIRGIPQLRLLLEPTLSVVLFDRPGWDDAAYLRWSRRLALEGRILCIPTQWKGRTVSGSLREPGNRSRSRARSAGGDDREPNRKLGQSGVQAARRGLTSWQVTRAVQTRLPTSSTMTIS